MYKSDVKFPAYNMCRANETRYSLIADVMSRDRYQKCLHVSDNILRDLDGTKKNFTKYPQQRNMLEQIVWK